MKSTATFLTVGVLICCVSGRVWAWGTEDFGHTVLNEANYRDWPDIMPLVNDPSRVYHSWVNGNEQFYYRGDATALNNALRQFAACKAEVHEVLLRPAPCEVKSFNRTKTIRYDWNLHILGGIAQVMTTLDQGSKIWSKYPTMTVCIGGDISLEKLEIPKGVSIIDVADLSRRYREALASTDKTVRGWGAGHLARLDPYNTENLAAITKLLKDEDNWVRLNAAGALVVFGKKAESALPTLRDMLSTEDKQLKARIAKTIEKIQQAKDATAAEQAYNSTQKMICEFCNSRKR